jgi:hypothetical protein
MEENQADFSKNRVFWLKLLEGARYKDKKPHFEISVKLRIF